MDKVILAIVVLCCTSQALCQTDAVTNSSGAESVSEVTEGQWLFTVREAQLYMTWVVLKCNFWCFFILKSSYLWTPFIEAPHLCHHSNCVCCRCDNDLIGSSHCCIDQRTWSRGKYHQFSFTIRWETNNFSFEQVVLLVIALGQLLARGFASAPPLPQYNAAPFPIVYQRHADAAATAPVWLE